MTTLKDRSARLRAPDAGAEPTALDQALTALGRVFGDRLLTTQAAREGNGAAESGLPARPPDAVVMARWTGEMAETLRSCGRLSVPVIPFGAGSSIEGQVIASEGGISLDLSGMDRIIAVEAVHRIRRDLDHRAAHRSCGGRQLSPHAAV